MIKMIGKTAFKVPQTIESPIEDVENLNPNAAKKIVTIKVYKALLSPEILRKPSKIIKRKTGVKARKIAK